MIVSSIARFTAINSMYNAVSNTHQNNNAMMGMLNNSTFSGDTFQRSCNKEKALIANNICNGIQYKCAEAQEASLNNLEKENIKRTFSLFA